MTKKILAIVLAMITFMTSIPIEGMAAQETVSTVTEEELAEETENSEELLTVEETSKETGASEMDVSKTEGTGEAETEKEEGEAGELKTEETGAEFGVSEAEGTETEVTENKKLEMGSSKVTETKEAETGVMENGENESTEAEEKYLIEYLMINQSNVSIDEIQQIVLGIDCDKEIEEAVLYYHKQDSEEVLEQSYTAVIDGAVLFEILFDDLAQAGAYLLDSVTFKVDGKLYTESFLDAGIEAIFGLNAEIEAEPDAVLDDGTAEEIESVMDIVRIDEDGNTVSETSLEEAIKSAEAEQPATFNLKRSSEIVIVLDPGHDETHAGAQHNGLSEEELNLKIALYCREELEAYQGVKVYLTRDSDGKCPYPGTTAGKCNEKRVAYSQEVGADIYVSLHNNSSSSTSANGAMVFYPNKNYNSSASTGGKGLAEQIQDNLVALGLYDRGITVKDSADYQYPDGSTADYYAVIRNSKLVGIPGIIVEHAFMSNTNDANNFLNSNSRLKKLGVADAEAIASYYGLTKEIGVTADSVKVSNVNSTKGTATMKASNVQPSDRISKVSFAVWSKSDQSDLFWYNVKNGGIGNYEATLDISNHKYNYGTYCIDAYVYDIYGNSHYIGGSTCTFKELETAITLTEDTEQKIYNVTTTTGRCQSVDVAVWSDKGGQDDLIWYKAEQNASGAYVAEISVANHKTAGLYYVDVYVTKAGGSKTYIGEKRFTVTVPTVEKIEITNKNEKTGTFDVVLSGVSTVPAVSKLQVPVWSKKDQSDLYWYTAMKQSDGSYKVAVSIVNHNYNYGTYYADIYLTTTNGIYQYMGGKTVIMNISKANVTVSANVKESQYTLTASATWPNGSIKKVEFAVWSQNGGQDDLIWYTGSKNTSEAYTVNVPIENHKTTGTYSVHVYVTGTDGSKIYVGGTTFKVTVPTVEKIEILNKNEGTGTFDVVLTGVSSVSGVSKLQIPVWSKKDQSDLYWYTAIKQFDGSYKVTVSLSNHNYNYGTYYVHSYLTAGNGIYQYMGQKKVNMKISKAEVTAANNTKETQYTLTALATWPNGSIKKVQFAVWSQTNGQDDLIWYEGWKNILGAYTVDVPITNHKTAGNYSVHVYVTGTNGTRIYVGGTTFKVTSPTVEKIEILNKDEGTGTFDVVMAGVSSVSDVSKLQVPVWNRKDQSDLYWYTAKKQSDGSYKVTVNLSNHKYNYGTYYVDTYLTTGNGIYQYLGGKSVTMNAPKAKIVASANTTQKKYTLTATSVGVQGGVKSLKFAVWSQVDGQDDLVWYTAKNESLGKWTTNAIISNHKTAGKYYVDAYAVSSSGTEVYLGGTTFSVEGPSASTVTLVNYNEENGTFGVKIAGVEAVSGIEGVKVAVWSSVDQRDLVWYNARLFPGGTYQITADIRNHQNNKGTYYADAYITDNNGIKIYAGGITCSIVNVTKFLNATTIHNGVDYAPIYDFNYYREKYLDIREAFGDDDKAALEHFVNWGMAEGRQGCESFNVYTYRNRYPDLRAVYGDDLKAYYMHFLNYGETEGRDAENIGDIVYCYIAKGSKEEMMVSLSVQLEDVVKLYSEYYIVQTDLYDGTVEKVWISKEGTTGAFTENIVISGKEQVESALMGEFTLAVKDNIGNIILSSNSLGISNPEAIAQNTAPIFKGTSKKGLQGVYYASDSNSPEPADARYTNTKQTLINLDLSTVVSKTPKSGYISYSYKGNTYYFSDLADLKTNIKSLNFGYKQYLYGNSGRTPVAVSLCLLLKYNEENNFLIDPAARTYIKDKYYTLNVREEYARETLEALFFYLGETFGQEDCYVSNWILGNEINSSKAWNYSGSLDFDTYMECYATAFRMLYTAVKSEKTGNTVSISLDNGWTAAPDTYAGKVTLDTFAKKIHAQNPNIDWSIAYHPYSHPLTRGDFWNDYSNTTDNISTPYISMRNINVLTNYAGTLESTYGKKSGSIRILLTEQGYSYAAGKEVQAQAIARGYYIAEFNDRIDAFIIRAIVDDEDEAKGKLYFGLMNSQQDKRISYYVYEHMDSDLSRLAQQSAEGYVTEDNYTNFNNAKSILCNTNWNAIVPGFNASKLAGIK